MVTDQSTLPQFKGRAVPWVTRWTNEILRLPYSLRVTREGVETYYPDGKTEDRMGGTLWQREGITRGGEPEWAQVNTYRQRFAMRKCACQVCGERITTKPVRFLMPLNGMEVVPPDEFHDEPQVITIQAPTCDECIPLALKLCPHLKKYGYQIVKVANYELWGIYGEVVFTRDNQMRRIQTYVEYDSQSYGPEFSMGQVMAKQQVIRLDKFVIEEKHEKTDAVPQEVS